MTSNDLPREARTGPIFHPDWGTHAYAAYNANTTGLSALMAMVFPEDDEARETSEALRNRRASVDSRFSGPWAIDTAHTMLSWQVAMRVSAVEVYLQDALTFLAVYVPEFIRSRGSTQSWEYDEIRQASDADTTLWMYCDRWARAFVADGGPKRWTKALQGSGLGSFEDVDIAELEAMWGYRHLCIHNAGRLSAEYARRHAAAAERLWRDGLSRERLDAWAATADLFVERVERGLAGRLRAHLGDALITEREELEMQRQFADMDARLGRSLIEKFPEERERIEAAWGSDETRRAITWELLTRGTASANEPPGTAADVRTDEGAPRRE